MSECHEIVVIIRPSFKKICDGDTCRAALFNHLLYWISRKVKGEKRNTIPIDEIHWYGTAEEICAGIDCAWSINKVRKEIRALVDANLIGQCHHPVNGWDQTRHYFLGEKQGQAIRAACEKHGICLRHLGLSPDLLHLLNKVNAFDNNGKCNCQISEIDLPNQVIPTAKYGSAIPKNDTKITSKNSSKEEEENHATSPHPLWSLWRKSIGRNSDQSPNERDLNYCHELTWICQQAQVELTITIIHAVRDQFKQTNKDKQGWFLGNLVTELTNYLDRLPSSQPEEMTEEEAEQLVLWSRHPSKIITMMERGENTIEDHWQELVWMSHSEAREYGYDSPLARRYTPEEIERYKQLTSQQTACIAQKAGSYEHTHLSHTAANAVESTYIFLTQQLML